MTIATKSGRRNVYVSTLIVRDRADPLVIHLLRDDARDRSTPSAAREPAAHLTARQLQVVRLLAEGVTARRIAARLGLAETTVRNHIRAVLSELGVHSQLEAVAKARRQGLV
jgi:DNA-binding NarL/FixJ family response regulator